MIASQGERGRRRTAKGWAPTPVDIMNPTKGPFEPAGNRDQCTYRRKVVRPINGGQEILGKAP